MGEAAISLVPPVGPKPLGVLPEARAVAEPSSDRWAGESLEPALGLPAHVLGSLPRPLALSGSVFGQRIRFAGEREAGVACFDADEWAALVTAAEADRVWASDLAAFCRRKREEPAWRLTLEEALAGAQPDPDERWSVRRVLERLGMELHEVQLAA